MPTNAEIEQRWIDAWNDLVDLARAIRGASCRLPDGQVVEIEECKAWLQESAYQGWHVGVEAGAIDGIIASRWR